ncbi:MAG: hypothetical protein PHF63_00545 [Herbinix sp.]|nr:hypothetical protein [Herbinix sp.]
MTSTTRRNRRLEQREAKRRRKNRIKMKRDYGEIIRSTRNIIDKEFIDYVSHQKT